MVLNVKQTFQSHYTQNVTKNQRPTSIQNECNVKPVLIIKHKTKNNELPSADDKTGQKQNNNPVIVRSHLDTLSVCVRDKATLLAH